MPGCIRKANKEDMTVLKEFLLKANVKADDLTEEKACFLLLEDETGALKGTLGMEMIAEFGILRSLVVTSDQAEKQIYILFEQMVELAKDKGMRSLFLATNKSVALPFFNLLGFKKVGRGDLPLEFYQSQHIRHVLNVDNSLFLKISI